jgi:hypothetical protein
MFKPYIELYLFHLKYKTDISAYLEAYKTLMEYKSRYDKLQDKLKVLSIKGNTKYSMLIFIRENRLTTTPEDAGYAFELEMFHIKRVMDISTFVLEKQMQWFKNILYKKYQLDIVKFRKAMIDKCKKNSEIWKGMQELIQ